MATKYSVSRKHAARTKRLVAVAKHDGIAIPKGLQVNSTIWGPAHIKLARAVQQKHRMKDQSGAPTMELRLFLFPPTPKSELATRSGLSQVGVTEHPLGSNSGKEVDIYIDAGGDNVAEAWCGCFVKWCCDRAGIKLPRFYYPRARNWADYLPHVSLGDARRGDVVIIRWRNGTFHVARLLEVLDLPSGRAVKTVDGNRSDRVGVWITSADLVFAIVRTPE